MKTQDYSQIKPQLHLLALIDKRLDELHRLNNLNMLDLLEAMKEQRKDIVNYNEVVLMRDEIVKSLVEI